MAALPTPPAGSPPSGSNVTRLFGQTATALGNTHRSANHVLRDFGRRTIQIAWLQAFTLPILNAVVAMLPSLFPYPWVLTATRTLLPFTGLLLSLSSLRAILVLLNMYPLETLLILTNLRKSAAWLLYLGDWLSGFIPWFKKPEYNLGDKTEEALEAVGHEIKEKLRDIVELCTVVMYLSAYFFAMLLVNPPLNHWVIVGFMMLLYPTAIGYVLTDDVQDPKKRKRLRWVMIIIFGIAGPVFANGWQPTGMRGQKSATEQTESHTGNSVAKGASGVMGWVGSHLPKPSPSPSKPASLPFAKREVRLEGENVYSEPILLDVPAGSQFRFFGPFSAVAHFDNGQSYRIDTSPCKIGWVFGTVRFTGPVGEKAGLQFYHRGEIADPEEACKQ